MNPYNVLGSIPSGLRDPLLEEYQDIVQNYAEHRWKPSELSGGRFCEIVFTVLEGYASGNYAARPKKPPDFCRSVSQIGTGHECSEKVSRSSSPRILPAIYEVRNNRGVGHAGGDVDLTSWTRPSS